MENQPCTHIAALERIILPNNYECAECIKGGSSWVHLRTCQTCGETLCCDSSPMKHMTAHHHKTAHSVVASAEPGEQWLWCYTDESFVQY